MVSRTLVCGVLLLLSCTVSAQSDRACVTIGRTRTPPRLDGAIDADEWGHAAMVSGFVTNGAGALAQPGTTVALMFDDRALYLAFRCSEPDGERPRALARAHDDAVSDDDCVQLYIAPENIDGAADASISFGGYEGAYDTWYKDIRAYYEFAVNGAGSMTESRNDVRDWDAAWEARVQRQQGAWSAEICIPFAAIGASCPAPGALWGLNLFRGRQPDMSGWVFPPFGGYRPLPLGAVCFADTVPLLRQHSPASPLGSAGPLRFEVVNPLDRPARVEAALVVGDRQVGTRIIAVSGQSTEEVSLPCEIVPGEETRLLCEFRVDGVAMPLLASRMPLPQAPSCRLSLHSYGIPGFVEGSVMLDPGMSAAKAVLVVSGDGVSPKQATESLLGRDGGRVSLPVSGAPGETFQATFSVLDASGKVLSTEAIEGVVPAVPAWLGTRVGLPLGVLPPWTPMRTSDRNVTMLGKRITFGDNGLPVSIVTAGEELLAAPIRLQVRRSGRPIVWKAQRCDIVEQAEDHVKVHGLWHGSDMVLDLTCTVEYDGFCWFEVALSSSRGADIDGLAFEIPLRPEAAQYAYRGSVQRGGALSPEGLRQPISGNLWVGSAERGLAWLTESQEWVLATDRGRQVEIVPGVGQTLWRSTLVDTSMALVKPYAARFALHITPAKPVTLRKSRIYHGAYYGLEDAGKVGSMFMQGNDVRVFREGSFECWLKPSFDPGEVYDPNTPLSDYNRQFLVFSANAPGAGAELLMLYYNADDRGMRLLKQEADGSYSVCVASPAPLAKGQWNYVGMSWGDHIRLNVNGKTTDALVPGSIKSDTMQVAMRLRLQHFAIDEVRLSRVQRPLNGVPTAPLEDDADTVVLNSFDTPGALIPTGTPAEVFQLDACALAEGRFGQGLTSDAELALDRLARDGKRIVIFHENWSRYQGYPDLEQIPKLKRLADACHARGLLFLVYFNQSASTACPEWPALKDDLRLLPAWKHYERTDIPQDCYGACVNGPYGDLLLDGIARLADDAGIDGVYMDGTTVPWSCGNPSHLPCATYLGEGRYLAHTPLRATRFFMKRLRNIFATRRKAFFLDAHTGGCINIATESFCDGHWDGETLARYKPGYRLSPDAFLTAYMAKPFGLRGELLPSRHTMDEALAICLIHDTATRGQPAAVDQAWAPYEDDATRFIGYWDASPLYTLAPATVLASVYLKADRALVVLGNQRETAADCTLELRGLLQALPAGVVGRDAIHGNVLGLEQGTMTFTLPGRMWQMIELRLP